MNETLFGEICFFISVCSLVFVTWLLCTQPQNYWVFFLVSNSIMVADTWLRNKKKGWEYFMADFCYVVNFWAFLYFTICYLKANVSSLAFMKSYLDPFGAMLFRLAFTWSSGVLAAAVLFFRNAVVFHSTYHMAIWLVHIGPPIVVWTLRWFSEPLNLSWPDTFHTGCTTSSCVGTMFDLIVVPSIGYILLWTIPYIIFIFIIKANSIRKKGKVTMFSYYEKQLFGEAGLIPLVKYPYFNKRIVKAAIYMLMHGSLSMSSFIWAWVLWQNFYVHTGYLLFLFAISVWNGATYYFNVCMNAERMLKLKKKQEEEKKRDEDEEKLLLRLEREAEGMNDNKMPSKQKQGGKSHTT